MSTVSVGSIHPVPSEEEAAAIAAAVTMMWPRPVMASADHGNGRTSESWRFSGRWWTSSHIVRRPRPGF